MANVMLRAFARVRAIHVHACPTIQAWLLRACVALLTRGTSGSSATLAYEVGAIEWETFCTSVARIAAAAIPSDFTPGWEM